MNHSDRTLLLPQAAEFLKAHPETVRRRAATGELSGAKVGRSWVFLQADLVAYLRSLYPNQASQGVINHRNKTIWHSTKETKSIGLISTTMVQEYNAALGLAKK